MLLARRGLALEERRSRALGRAQPSRQPWSSATANPISVGGSPGGDQQDQWTLLLLLRHFHERLNLQEAIDSPMFNSAHFPASFTPRVAKPGVLSIEDRFEPEMLDELARRGHLLNIADGWSLGRLCAAPAAGGVDEAAATPCTWKRTRLPPIVAVEPISSRLERNGCAVSVRYPRGRCDAAAVRTERPPQKRSSTERLRRGCSGKPRADKRTGWRAGAGLGKLTQR